MDEQDLREQNRYQRFYNANKLAYQLDPHNKPVLSLAEAEKQPHMVFNPDKMAYEEVTAATFERANDPSLRPLKSFLDERKQRLTSNPKEHELDYLTQ